MCTENSEQTGKMLSRNISFKNIEGVTAPNALILEGHSRPEAQTCPIFNCFRFIVD